MQIRMRERTARRGYTLVSINYWPHRRSRVPGPDYANLRLLIKISDLALAATRSSAGERNKEEHGCD
jgi:hypothetical protein